MTKEQKKALAYLSRAFAACKKADLSFTGMDAELNAYDADELQKIQDDKGCDLYNAQQDCSHDLVNTHGCYLDSGGW